MTTTFHERLIKEKDDLEEKLRALNLFYKTPIFKGLPPYEQSLLYAQDNVMCDYGIILHSRLAVIEAKTTDTPTVITLEGTQMKKYIGTKLINAVSMTRAAYNVFRGWTLPTDENGDDEGYLVEYLDGGKPNTTTHAGYVSWSPKEQFDNAYRATTGLTFGLAVDALKCGKLVSRAGWNGKGMWVKYIDSISNNGLTFNAYLAIKNVNGSLSTWVPSINDVLADDWQIQETTPASV